MQFICRFLSLVLLPTAAFAGAWLQPQGKGQFAVNTTYFTGNQFYDAEGSLSSQARFTKTELQPYAEYGLTDRITVGGSFALQHVNQSGNGNDGLADTELFARARLWHDEKTIVSIQPLIKLPSLYSDGGVPRGGSRSADGELSLLYGHSLDFVSDRDYLDARLGYRVRNRGLNPQWRADLAYGMQLGDHWQLIPAIRGIYTQDIGSGPFAENGEQDFRLLKAELGARYALDEHRALLATVADHVAGRNVGAGYSISLGFAGAF